MGFTYCQTVHKAESEYVVQTQNRTSCKYILKKNTITIHNPHKNINILTFDRYQGQKAFFKRLIKLNMQKIQNFYIAKDRKRKDKRLKVGKMLTKQDKWSLFIMCYNVSIKKERLQ